MTCFKPPYVLAFLSMLLWVTGQCGEADAAPDAKASFVIDDLIKPTAGIRTRYEMRDQDGLAKAHAETIRGRLGLLINDANPLNAFIEYEGTLAADRNSYRAASVHGPAGKAIIADPESHELNRLWLAYHADAFDSTVKIGRQRINLDNQRFVGAVGWRQNEQTFDAVALETSTFEDVVISYHYINQVNRIFGSGPIANPAQTDFEGNTHLAHFTWSGIEDTTVKTYGYFMDLGNRAGNANSNNTFGFSFDRTFTLECELELPLYGEFAWQEDGANSPLNYETTYFHIETGLNLNDRGVTVGYERLGSDNGVGFRTPLATLHKFNGYNDQFLNTPANGLSDFYAGFHAKLPGKVILQPAYHWFGPAGDFGSFGEEFDIGASRKINDNLTILTKFSHYMADGFGADSNNFIVEFNYSY